MIGSLRRGPVLWARLTPVGSVIARLLSPRQPAVLVFSIPRSGSSWVGETLGHASDAVYLREPVTRGAVAAGASVLESVDFDPTEVPMLQRQLCARAFAAHPAFPPSIVGDPAKWSLAGRRSRRLVVKEVNPLLLEWILTTHRPRIVFLVRHPAAVAASYARLGWDTVAQRARMVRYLTQCGMDRWARELASAPSEFWGGQGAFQAAVMRVARDRLLDMEPSRVVEYETVCARPVDTFRTLYEFAGLRWDESAAGLVAQHSSRGDTRDTYGTARDSASMIDRWRSHVTSDQLARIRDAYLAFELPWYSADHHWAGLGSSRNGQC